MDTVSSSDCTYQLDGTSPLDLASQQCKAAMSTEVNNAHREGIRG